jgi:hypothetical protein
LENNKSTFQYRKNFRLAFFATAVIAVLVFGAATAAELLRDVVYTTDQLKLEYVPFDLFTLFVALPVLLVSLWLAARGSLGALLLLPGVLFYLLYSEVAYLVGLDFSVLFPLYVLLAPLVAYTLIYLEVQFSVAMDPTPFKAHVPARLSAGVLIVLTVFSVLYDYGEMFTALAGGMEAGRKTVVWIADLTTIAPAALLGGLLLWRRDANGYMAAPGLLLAYCLLLGGAIASLVYEAAATPDSPDVFGVVLVSVFLLLCLVPLVWYLRGIRNTQKGGSHDLA